MVARPDHMPLDAWLLNAAGSFDHGSSHVRRLASLLSPHLRLIVRLALAAGLIGEDHVQRLRRAGLQVMQNAIEMTLGLVSHARFVERHDFGLHVLIVGNHGLYLNEAFLPLTRQPRHSVDIQDLFQLTLVYLLLGEFRGGDSPLQEVEAGEDGRLTAASGKGGIFLVDRPHLSGAPARVIRLSRRARFERRLPQTLVEARVEVNLMLIRAVRLDLRLELGRADGSD